jgi:pimeloyl-ACP methyl ester carboxylesterase
MPQPSPVFFRLPSRVLGPLLLLALVAPARAADAAPAPCRVPGIPNEVLCGRLERPLDPTRPDGRRIEVHYLVVPAVARRKLPDPVLMLAGGPGQSAIALAPRVLPLFSRLNNRRDLVFVDQRGTGRSAPLTCPEPRDDALSAQFDPARQRELLAACREQLARLPYVGGPDGLRHFTTFVAMQDVDAVRQRLGVARWNVVGGSYGTRAALELQRQFPQTVRRTVLDGVAPPDMVLPASMSTDGQAALDAVLAACEAEPACERNYPALRADWQRLLDGLPRRVEFSDPRTGRRERVDVSRDMVMSAVRTPLYGPSIAAALPQAIAEAAAGRFEALAGLSAMVGPRPGRPGPLNLAAGMHFSVVCAEDVPRLRASADAPGRDFGAGSARFYEQVCADWPRGEVPEAFYTVPPAASPVLIFSGGADPVTPPRHGARVARSLGALASHRVVPQAGHGLLAVGCVRDVVFRFVDAATPEEALTVDSRCVERVPRPPAVLAVAVAPRASEAGR